MTKNKTLDHSLAKFQFSKGQQLLLLMCNYIQLVHIAATLCLLFLPWIGSAFWRAGTAAVIFYLLPPLLARLTLRLLPIRSTCIALPSREYFTWWFLLNLQMVFCRFPFFEELLRVLPGVYSAWLRLWGARIGKYTYWAAGVRILDRSFLDIGHGVIFGAGVRLAPHIIAENKQGRPELLLADIVIGDRAVIGGYALLAAGTRIAPDESTRALLRSAPFTSWQGGKKVSRGNKAA
jgi:hypothetical protein